MPNYLSQKSIGNIEKESTANKALYASGKYVNTEVLYRAQVSESSQVLKQDRPEVSVCHISDREFDCEAFFEHIANQGDEFVTRLKMSRLSNEQKVCYTKTGKVSKKKAYKKLIDKSFTAKATYIIPKLTIKSKTWLQVTCLLEWENLELNGHSYRVVRTTLSQGNKSLFEHPMLLITNKNIKGMEDAKQVYQAYILRFKIEVVFKFLKQNLGWESFQVRDFESIKNLLALVFFLAGYFKELEEYLKEHPLAVFLCQLARSKGKVTIFFLLKGLEILANFQLVKQAMDQFNISEQEIDDFIKLMKGDATDFRSF